MGVMFKYTMDFSWAGRGWSETLYWSNGLPNFDAAFSNSKVLMDARRLLLGGGVQLQACRVEDVTFVGAYTKGKVPDGPNPASINYNADGGAGTGRWAPFAVSGPEDGALVDLFTVDNLHRRQFILKGLSGSAFTPFGAAPTKQQLVGLFATDVGRFMASLGLTPAAEAARGPSLYFMRVRNNRNPPAAFSIFAITTVGGGDNHWLLTISDTSDLLLGDLIHVHGVTGCWAKGLNGDHRITNITDVPGGLIQVELDASQCCMATINYNLKGTWYPVRYVDVPIGTYSTARYDTRKTGSAFFGSRGRRSAACCG